MEFFLPKPAGFLRWQQAGHCKIRAATLKLSVQENLEGGCDFATDRFAFKCLLPRFTDSVSPMKIQLVSLFMLQMAMVCSAPKLRGDEGMYLFNDLPVKLLQERYGFQASEDWANHLRLSSVRFNSGGSGSFISSNGLVLTSQI